MSESESQGRCGSCGGQVSADGPCDWCVRISERTDAMAPYAARAMREAVREALAADRPEIANKRLFGELPVPIKRSGL